MQLEVPVVSIDGGGGGGGDNIYPLRREIINNQNLYLLTYTRLLQVIV